jgi:hypothetical protein|nr:hypothetical protein [Agrobacterium tumefaciens]
METSIMKALSNQPVSDGDRYQAERRNAHGPDQKHPSEAFPDR